MKRVTGILMVLALFWVGTAMAQEMPIRDLLTPDQRAKIQKIHTNYQKQQIELRAKLKIATLDLRQLLRSARVPDVAKVQKKQAEISKIKAEIAQNRINQQIAVRKILTDEQWKKMQALRAERMKMRVKQGKKGMWHHRRDFREHKRFPKHHPMMGPMPQPPRDND